MHSWDLKGKDSLIPWLKGPVGSGSLVLKMCLRVLERAELGPGLGQDGLSICLLMTT